MLARRDGGRPRLSNERYWVRGACRVAEARYGLRSTAPGDRTAARRPTRAEHEKTRRSGWREAPRITLRRGVNPAAAGASSEQEFSASLDGAGVLVRKRLSTRNSAEITGYAVALPGDAADGGGPVWFGGGKLAADLTLPKLRRRWDPARRAPTGRFTAPERDAIWEQAAQAASSAAAQIRSPAASSPAAAADAAWAAADILHAAAAAVCSPGLPPAARPADPAGRAAADLAVFALPAARRPRGPLGLVERQVPGVAGDEFAAGVRLVRLDATGAEQDPDSLAAQVLDAAPERGAGGERGIDEGKNDDRHAQAGGLGENAEGVGVADALGPLVDRVVGGRGDNDRVG